MFVRPRNCRYCGHGYHALGHVVQYAASKGLWNIADLSAEQANKTPIYNAIDNTDPFGFYGFGHGNDCEFTGDLEEDIFTCAECDKLNGKLVYLLSCLTANGLGPKIMENGAIGYAGFDISWTWLSRSGTDGDPYEDPYAICFWESANEFWMALLDGLDFHEAAQKSIDKYNEWIDYWFYENPEDPASQDCMMWLAYDRDGLVAISFCDTLIDQISCETEGCYWYDDACHSVPLPPPRPGIGVALIPIILIVGVAFIVGTK